MKKIKYTFLVLSIIKICNAQDIITRNDSSKVNAILIEINPQEIKYKLFNYLDGPIISNNVVDIAYIYFKNGTIEKFPKKLITPNQSENYNPNRYNLDGVPVSVYVAQDKIKKCEKLYTRKNYIGFNYISFLNTALGFNYMRDVKKANLIINVPFAFGLGSPSITNSLYSRNYLDGAHTTKYELMKYQIGISALFAPSMNKEVNFLMGPSFNFSEYKMSVNTQYSISSASPYQYTYETFSNNFILRREHYGLNMGFLARFSEKVNMNMLFTFGYKKDTYDQIDPFGINQINSVAKNIIIPKDNVMPYVNFAWSVGYRF